MLDLPFVLFNDLTYKTTQCDLLSSHSSLYYNYPTIKNQQRGMSKAKIQVRVLAERWVYLRREFENIKLNNECKYVLI